MINHVSFSVNDFQSSQDFYDQTLKVLGYERIMNFDDETCQVAGYGTDGRPSFWIGVSRQGEGADEFVGKARGFHVAFLAPDVESVNKWYEQCLQLGGQDNGKPGPRPYYHPGYYGAFIVDPNGWRIEACFQQYQGE